MDKAVMGTCNLRQRSKDCDLEIKCDGATFYVHRVIVCERSKVLARECDSATEGGFATPVEHTIFDANTLERMLHFMYRGDYTVPTSNGALVPANGVLTVHSSAIAATKTLARHLRGKPSGAMPFEQRYATLLYGRVIAHVYMYAIAQYYEMVDLKALALRRFKNSGVTMTAQEFLDVAKLVHLITVDCDDEIRYELLPMLMEEHADWLRDGHFKRALADSIELQPFAVAVMSAVLEKSVNSAAILGKEIEGQHQTSPQLGSNPDQLSNNSANSKRQITKLQEKLKHAENEKFVMAEKLASCEIWAKENFEKADNNHKAMQERDQLLENETARTVRLSLLILQKDEEIEERNETIRQKDERIRQKDLKIKEETNRANSYEQMCLQKDLKIKEEARRAKESLWMCTQKELMIKEETKRANQIQQMCTQKEQTIKQKDKLIRDKDTMLKKETERADNNYEVCTQNDNFIKQQNARGNRAFQHFVSAQGLINNFDGCRYCGKGTWPLLMKEGSKNKRVYVCCKHCNNAEYAQQAQLEI